MSSTAVFVAPVEGDLLRFEGHLSNIHRLRHFDLKPRTINMKIVNVNRSALYVRVKSGPVMQRISVSFLGHHFDHSG